MCSAIHLLQPRPGISQPKAFSYSSRGSVQPGAVVLHSQSEQVAVSIGSNLNLTRCDPGNDSMLDGVLNDRLKDEVRHAGVKCLRLDLHIDCEAIVEPHVLNLQVTP